jgi:organic hydroperoxide reductase OsmC/OhrA
MRTRTGEHRRWQRRENESGSKERHLGALSPVKRADATRARYDSKMAEYTAEIHWKRSDNGFLSGKYSREHVWNFDGGLAVPASPSPHVVPVPYSNPACVDPEEAFVAAIASCHMLTFLYLASRDGFQIDSYKDQAVGTMRKNERGIPWINQVKLSPRVEYGDSKLPSPSDERRLHHQAHEQCFIANSVKTEIVFPCLPAV